MNLTVEVKDCRDCPMNKSHTGHGECWNYCDHDDSPGGYDSILYGCREEFTEIPNWCPILDKKEDK